MKDKTSSIQVIDRSVRLLDCIAHYRDPVTLKVLAADSGLHPSTAFRILASLQENSLVERDSAGHYGLGRKLLWLAGRVRRGIDIREEAKDIMQRLCDQLGETINLTVREGDQVIYIERAIPNRMMRVEQVIGSRAPLHVTAVGKLMLGRLGEPFVRGYVARAGLPAYTRHTITEADALLDAVRRASAAGYALDDEEAELGVGCIGVPILDHTGQIIAGLSVSAPIERRQDQWVGPLQQAGRELSERMGHIGDTQS
jgi:DNA-binding IclR family transcriptional regulator